MENNTNNTLPAEVQERSINYLASLYKENYVKERYNNHSLGNAKIPNEWLKIRKAFETGATEYALKWQESQSLIASMEKGKQKLREALLDQQKEIEEWKGKYEHAIKELEENMKLSMRLNIPGVSPQEQEHSWQEYKKRNNL
jgi:hypothetical protein